MPTQNWEMAPRFQTRIDGNLKAFVGAIISTARNGVENELMLMPGYRDRIAHVLTRKDEGGLRLNMPQSKIQKLSKRGRHAAELLVSRFHPASKVARSESVILTWANQRWVRYRSTMAGLERFLAELKQGWDSPCDGAPAYAEIKVDWSRRDTKSYPWLNPKTEEAANRCTGEILHVAGIFRSEAETIGPIPESSVFDGIVQSDGHGRDTAPRPKLGLFSRPVGGDPNRLRSYSASAGPEQIAAFSSNEAAEK
jgi:hypothetical protein